MRVPDYAKTREISERFIDLAGIIGGDMALFCLCAAYNLPAYVDSAVPTWDEYVRFLEKLDRAETFIDGETDADAVLQNGASEGDRWEREWGIGDPDNPYTTADYKELDRTFKVYSARLDAAGGMDAQQEDTLRYCSRMAVLRDKCVAKGDKESIGKASTLDKMIQDNLSAENLRKKDAKPIENARVDGIIDALQKKYGVGADMTFDQMMEIIYKWFHSHHYPETADAAEHSLMAIINTTRMNDDQPELTERPAAVSMKGYESEFAVIPSEMEEDAYEYLGLTRQNGYDGREGTVL